MGPLVRLGVELITAILAAVSFYLTRKKAEEAASIKTLDKEGVLDDIKKNHTRKKRS